VRGEGAAVSAVAEITPLSTSPLNLQAEVRLVYSLSEAMSYEQSRRARATAVVVRGGKVLLVREAGVHYYSLPGGGMHEGEAAEVAAVREIREELGLLAAKVERLGACDHAGFMNDHHVCLIQADGDPRLAGHEIDAFCWWDMKESITLHPHVNAILSKVDALGKIE
jgi:8-oxo-dGTP pyrophosphatase MutT (NUDIX family)